MNLPALARLRKHNVGIGSEIGNDITEIGFPLASADFSSPEYDYGEMSLFATKHWVLFPVKNFTSVKPAF